MMELGGNSKAREFFRTRGGYTNNTEFSDSKYDSRAAEMYREKLKAEAEGGLAKKKSAFADFAAKTKDSEDNQRELDKEKPKDVPDVSSLKLTVSEKPESSTSSDVFGAKKGSNPKGLGGKKLNNDFFADFDAEEEEEEETKESFQDKMGSSRLQYSEEDEKTNGKKNTGSNSSANKEFTKPSAPKPNIGSDSFVPTRSKAQVAKETSVQSSTYGYAQQQFSNSKAISSNQFFGEDQKTDPERERRLGKFEGARAISSADYFERNEENMGETDPSDIARRIAYTAKTDLSHVKEVISDSGRKLSEWGSNFFSELSERYGN